MGRRNFKINISDVTHASSLITSTTIPAPKGSFKWDRFQNGFDPNRKVFVVNAGRRFSHIPSPLLPLLARSFASEKLFGYQVVGNTFLGRETTTCVWWWCTCMRVCVCMDGREGCVQSCAWGWERDRKKRLEGYITIIPPLSFTISQFLSL